MNAKSAYLLLYNSLLAGGWAFVLFQVCRQLSDGAGLRGVFEVGLHLLLVFNQFVSAALAAGLASAISAL